ncbi:MAG: disulfide bond formation protein B [Nevskia sp.]
MTRLSFRSLSALGFLACVSGLAFALYLQHFRDLEPCPMCIFQRIAMLGAGLFFLLGAVHAPKRGGRWAYAVLALLAAVIGAGIAARHVWLQSLPPDQVPACGPTLDYLLSFMPITEVVTNVLRGDANCARINAAWLGISLPGWTLAVFVALALYALLLPKLARRDSIFRT